MTPQRQEKIDKLLAQRVSDVILVLEDIHDPHNAAAILRTCDALGIGAAYYIFEKEEYYNPKKVGKSSSSSANKWIDIETFRSSEDCFTLLKKAGYTVYATTLSEGTIALHDEMFVSGKIALVVGNEHRGVSEFFEKNADVRVYFPMKGFVQSLNVSVATALFLWEISRQRK